MLVVAAAVPAASAQDEPATLGFTLNPGSGPPGTRVYFEGDVPLDALDFDAYRLQHGGYGLSGAGYPPDCALIVAMVESTWTFTEDRCALRHAGCAAMHNGRAT